VETLADFRNARPALSEPIIDGILRRGHKMLLAGPSKAGKSFMLLQLAIAIAEGREWLGWPCRQGRVLYVNLELDRASAICRLLDLYGALAISPECMEDVDLWNLRGKALPMTDLAPRLIRRAAKRQYAAVIIDPIYKVITGDENAAHEMAKFCNQFDRVCAELGAAVIYCHHHSKGGQGQKHASDRASGSGVFARDPDAMLDLIELEVSEARRKQVVTRWECAAMATALDGLLPDWREDCPQDTMIVADHLAEWAIAKVGVKAVADARAPARDAAEYATGWRVEGILREFRDFDPRRFWFRWPIHVGDADGLLTDALAEGEEPPRKTRQESTAARQVEQHADAWDAYRKAKEEADGGPVTAKDMAVWMHDSKTGCVGLSVQAARGRIDAAGFVRNRHSGEVKEQEESAT
jgi:RecA-family ATPase